jgi:hypothetical protein
MADTAAPEASKPPAAGRSGKWTIVAIFLLGSAVLVGLYLSPRTRPPAEPQGLLSGLPDRPIRLVLLDCGTGGVPPETIAATVKQLHGDPDIVMLLNIDGTSVAPTAGALGMAATFHPSLGERVRPDAASGNTTSLGILSRHGLYDGAPIRLTERRSIGVRAVAAIDGHRLALAAIHIAEKPGAEPTPFPAAVGVVDLLAGRTGDGLFVRWNDDAGPTPLQIATRRESPAGLLAVLARPSAASQPVSITQPVRVSQPAVITPSGAASPLSRPAATEPAPH